MSISTPNDLVKCPICGADAERGCIYGVDERPLRWIVGEAGWKNKMGAASGGGEMVGRSRLLTGSYVEGIRCPSCHHITLQYDESA